MSTEATTCPNCKRPIEAGFKFCDYCGTRLDATPKAETPAPAKTDAPRAEPVTPAPVPKADEAPKKKPPLFERMQQRRAERRAEQDAPPARTVMPPEAGSPTPPKEEPAAAPEKPAPEKPPAPENPATAPEKPEPIAPVPTAPEKVDSPAIPPVPAMGARPAASTATPTPTTPTAPVSSTTATTPAPTKPVTPPTAPPAARFTSRPMTVEQLRENQGRVGIAGKLRWREGEEPPGPEDTHERTTPVPPPPPPAWRAVDRPKRSLVRTILVFLLHLVLAFLAGAVLLGVAAVVASLVSDGSVTLLEVRGLPIFIAGATAIIVFSLLQTGPRAVRGRTALISFVLGFAILVGGVALLYRPSLMTDAQRELDAALGVYGPDVESDVDRFTADVDAWNNEVNNYRTDLQAILATRASETDQAKRDAAFEQFGIAASGVEAALDGVQKRMVAHADAIEQAPLSEALRDLAAIYRDQLSGIRKLTRGVVANDQTLIASGDTGFKDTAKRAVEFFDEQVEPLLDRAEIDPNSLDQSVRELTRVR